VEEISEHNVDDLYGEGFTNTFKRLGFLGKSKDIFAGHVRTLGAAISTLSYDSPCVDNLKRSLPQKYDLTPENYTNFKKAISNFRRQSYHLLHPWFRLRRAFETPAERDLMAKQKAAKNQIKKTVLLMQLLGNIVFLGQLVTTGKHLDSSKDPLSEEQRKLFEPILDSCIELYKSLNKEQNWNISHRSYKIIVNYANREIEKTLKQPNRDLAEVLQAAEDAGKALFSHPVPPRCREFFYTLSGALFGAGVGILIGGFVGAFFGPFGLLLGSAVGGTLGAIAGALLASFVYHKDFAKTHVRQYQRDVKLLPNNETYKKAYELRGSFFKQYGEKEGQKENNTLLDEAIKHWIAPAA
jgi:hypothetical protein